MKKAHHCGFTLIEILVAIAVIAVMASVVIANMGQGSAQSRDAERLSDIRNIESALERYRLQNGRYPAGCNDPAPGAWDGQGE
jgi:general secretion pathway protein G